MARKKSTNRAKKQIKSRKKRPFFAYPLFIFLLLCAGVFLAAWTLRAAADDIFVTAKVSAPFVTQPATIDSPTDGAHFTSIPINVSGTCPLNAGYVEIFDNNVMRGTALCAADNTYQLSIDLFPDTNSLVARVFNITDDEGPASATVNVVYNVVQPQAPTPQPSKPGQPAPKINSPTLMTAFIYKGFRVGEKVEWPIEITGGTAPYAISVDWGDGNSDLMSRAQTGVFNITHTYIKSGGYKNSYTIKVKVSDANNQTGFIQFFVIVTPDNIGQAGITSKPTPKIPGGFNWLWLAWPAYLIVILMVLSYWLGEREELIELRKKGALKRLRYQS